MLYEINIIVESIIVYGYPRSPEHFGYAFFRSYQVQIIRKRSDLIIY